MFQFCLGIMQRLITQQAIDQKGARYITDTLWMLMETGTEEVKVLQTVTLLLTSNTIVHGDTLARVIRNILSYKNKMHIIKFYLLLSIEIFTCRIWFFALDCILPRIVQQ